MSSAAQQQGLSRQLPQPGAQVKVNSRGSVMQERQLRDLIESVRSGALPRRRFIERLVGLGLTAPMAALLLTDAGLAQAQTTVYKLTRRGGDAAVAAR